MNFVLSILVAFGLWNSPTTIHNPTVSSYTSAISVSAKLPEPAKPAQIDIASINLVGSIKEAGLNEKNLMWVPDDANTASWWKYGAKPGESGRAILAGHFKIENGQPGVFYDLNKLKIGEIITIVDNNNNRWNYKISEFNTYTVENFPTPDIYANSQTAELVLITCSGSFSASKSDYSHRLVVSAKMTESL